MLPKVKIDAAPINWEGLNKRFMNPGELEVLCHLANSVKAKTVIEFGINGGRTAKALLREVPTITKYVGIDVTYGYFTPKQVQRKEVPLFPGELVKDDPRVELLVRPMGSYELTSSDLPECDVAFIDGDHSKEGVLQDTYLAKSVVRPGGLIIYHDYNTVMKHGSYVVDVKETLEGLFEQGNHIEHVEGTWLAFQRM